MTAMIHVHDLTDEDKAEFSLDFGTAATSLILSSVSIALYFRGTCISWIGLAQTFSEIMEY